MHSELCPELDLCSLLFADVVLVVVLLDLRRERPTHTIITRSLMAMSATGQRAARIAADMGIWV